METQSEVVEDLVAAAGRGDRAAQQRLLADHWPVIRAVVRFRLQRLGGQLRNREEAVDLDQDVALKLLAELPQHVWQGRRAFIAWVKKVADNYLRDRQKYHAAGIRDRGAETRDDHLDNAPRAGSPSPESAMDHDRELQSLRSLLAQLKDEYAAAVMLFHMGWTHEEVGDMLGCTSEAARKLVARGLSKLQRLRAERQKG